MLDSSPRRQFIGNVLGIGGAHAALGLQLPQTSPSRAAGIFDVREHGAAGDGTRFDGKAVQSAIDACASSGGGTVRFPAGTYLTGTVSLRSRVRLYLEAGAVLLGSKRLADYPSRIPALHSYTDNYTEKSLIFGENLEDVGIEGQGAIDGQGAAFEGPYKVRPYMIRLVDCRRVSISGIRMADSPMWVLHCLACEDVHIHGITIRSRVNHNNDGIDIDCCRRVRISDCDIWSGDDAIVLKSTSALPTTDVTVANCVISSECNAVKMGTESNGGFQNITIGNCTIYDTRLAGLALEVVDGGLMDRVNISGIVMKNVSTPIFVRLGNRARPFQEGSPKPGVGTLKNVTISNIEATGAGKIGCAVSGISRHPIANLSLRGIRLAFPGGGTADDAIREIPESEAQYPEHSMFGTLPAYGLYCRHVQGLVLSDLSLSCAGNEERPALVCDDVQGLRLSGAELVPPSGGGAPVRLHQVRDALIQGCRALEVSKSFVSLSGTRTSGITLTANDLARSGKPVEAAVEVPQGAVFAEWNRTR